MQILKILKSCLTNWTIELDALKFLFGVLAVSIMERDTSAREKLFNYKRALVPLTSGHQLGPECHAHAGSRPNIPNLLLRLHLVSLPVSRYSADGSRANRETAEKPSSPLGHYASPIRKADPAWR